MNLAAFSIFELVGVELWDAEVTAEVEQVFWTEVASDSGEGEGTGAVHKDHCAAHVGAVENDPDVCGSVLNGATADGRGGDDVLPAAQVVGLADGVHIERIGKRICGELENVNADAVKVCDGVAGLVIRASDEACGHGQHGAVEGEAGFGGGLGAEPVKGLGDEFEWYGAGIGRAGGTGIHFRRALIRCSGWAGGSLSECNPAGSDEGGERQEEFQLHALLNARGEGKLHGMAKGGRLGGCEWRMKLVKWTYGDGGNAVDLRGNRV